MSRKWGKGRRKKASGPSSGPAPSLSSDPQPTNGHATNGTNGTYAKPINGQPTNGHTNGQSIIPPAPPCPPSALSEHPEGPSKKDMVLVRRAFKNGWNVPEKYKTAVVEQMNHIAGNSLDERNRIAASKVLLEADKTDQAFQIEAERKPSEVLINGSIKHDHIHRISIDEFRQLPLEQRLRILRGPNPLPIEDRATQPDAV